MTDPGVRGAVEDRSRWTQHHGICPERPLTQWAEEPRMWLHSSLTGRWEPRLPLPNLPILVGSGVCPSLPHLPPLEVSRESQVAWPWV